MSREFRFLKCSGVLRSEGVLKSLLVKQIFRAAQNQGVFLVSFVEKFVCVINAVLGPDFFFTKRLPFLIDLI